MDGAASFFVFVIIVVAGESSRRRSSTKKPIPRTQRSCPIRRGIFSSLFGLLNFVPWLFGHIPFLASQANAPWVEMLAAIVVPTIGLLIVLLLPWLDRSTTRSFASRGTVLWSTFIVIVGHRRAHVLRAARHSSQRSSGAAIDERGADPCRSPQKRQRRPPPPAARLQPSAAGAKVFSQNCTSCHGTNGQGQAGVAPPLAGNPFVTGDPKAVITVVENGLHGQTVMGQTYGAPMPAWKGTLSKSDLAAVITYIRGRWAATKLIGQSKNPTSSNARAVRAIDEKQRAAAARGNQPAGCVRRSDRIAGRLSGATSQMRSCAQSTLRCGDTLVAFARSRRSEHINVRLRVEHQRVGAAKTLNCNDVTALPLRFDDRSELRDGFERLGMRQSSIARMSTATSIAAPSANGAITDRRAARQQKRSDNRADPDRRRPSRSSRASPLAPNCPACCRE